jgi:hypothetical protein
MLLTKNLNFDIVAVWNAATIREDGAPRKFLKASTSLVNVSLSSVNFSRELPKPLYHSPSLRAGVFISTASRVK